MSLRSLVERGHEKIAWCVEWGWRRLHAPARSGWYGGGELERDRGVLGSRNSLMRRAKPGSWSTASGGCDLSSRGEPLARSGSMVGQALLSDGLMWP